MVKTILKQLAPFFILLGFIILAFSIQYSGLSIVSEETIQYGSYTWTYYKIDTHAYLSSLTNSLADTSIVNIFPELPQLSRVPDYRDVVGMLKFIVNTEFVYIFNWLIWALNMFILAPIKIILYPVRVIFSIIGLNTSTNDWIVAYNTMYSAEIPQIPYW